MEKNTYLKGGEFLVKESDPQYLFIPEDFSEEQKAIAQAMEQFLEKEIYPIVDEIDRKKKELIVPLMKKAAELGFLGPAIPADLGGLGLDYLSITILAEAVGPGGPFPPSLLAHTGIGTLPILYFGTPEQQQKYLPLLATGEKIGCYCLTEPNSGSDALAARTKAVLSGDHYKLTGEKIWITNAGFADIFIVFAQIEGDKFSAFIVEKEFEGLTVGEELKKMGIKGSSTCPVYLDECRVPKENLLGEVGKGHLIAFNILNDGRLKLAAATIGGAAKIAENTRNYAKERVQFKQPIANFGAIKHKIAEQEIRIFAGRSALYRTAQNMQRMEESLLKEGKSKGEALLLSSKEYAIECAIMKVMGSEIVDYVVDEGVQTYGGYGFSEEYPMARAYRDSRINRIFEGTNEINRLLSIDMLVKKAFSGQLDLLTPGKKIQEELMSIPSFDQPEGYLADEKNMIGNFKKAFLMIAGMAAKEVGPKLEQEEEIVMNLADMMFEIYLCESAWLRAIKINNEKGVEGDMVKVYCRNAAHLINRAGREAISAFADGDMLRILNLGLKRFTKYQDVNMKELRRKIAAHFLGE